VISWILLKNDDFLKVGNFTSKSRFFYDPFFFEKNHKFGVNITFDCYLHIEIVYEKSVFVWVCYHELAKIANFFYITHYKVNLLRHTLICPGTFAGFFVVIRGQKLPGGSCLGSNPRPSDRQPSAMTIRSRPFVFDV